MCTPVSNLYSDIKQFRAKYLSTINPNICGLIPGDYGEAHTNITVINNTELCDGALVDNYLSANDKRSCHGSIHHSSSWVEGCEQCRCWVSDERGGVMRMGAGKGMGDDGVENDGGGGDNWKCEDGDDDDGLNK